jgi:hypothetical protein
VRFLVELLRRNKKIYLEARILAGLAFLLCWRVKRALTSLAVILSRIEKENY